MHRPSTQEAISGDWSRRVRRGVPSGRTVFIKLESYSFAVRGDRSPFSCGLRMSSAATPPPLASRALNRGPDRSSSVAAGSTGPPAASTAVTGAPTLPATRGPRPLKHEVRWPRRHRCSPRTNRASPRDRPSTSNRSGPPRRVLDRTSGRKASPCRNSRSRIAPLQRRAPRPNSAAAPAGYEGSPYVLTTEHRGP